MGRRRVIALIGKITKSLLRKGLAGPFTFLCAFCVVSTRRPMSQWLAIKVLQLHSHSSCRKKGQQPGKWQSLSIFLVRKKPGPGKMRISRHVSVPRIPVFDDPAIWMAVLQYFANCKFFPVNRVTNSVLKRCNEAEGFTYQINFSAAIHRCLLDDDL